VKQGNPPHAALFSIVIDAIIKQLDLRGNICTCLKHCFACVDDTLITTRTIQSRINTFQEFKNRSVYFKLIVNKGGGGKN
jgi:orotate phosphoribosyltransferase-like protein